MKRLLLIVLPLLLIVGCSSPEPINYETTLIERDGVFYTKDTNQPYSGPVFSLDKKGRNKRESILEDGKMITYKELKWYENGQKKVEENYKDGERDGLVTVWYDNGQKREEGTFKNDKLDGLWTGWYENGQKELEDNYKDGEGFFTNSWNKNGDIMVKDGNGLYTQWYDNGQKKSESTYKDGKEDGLNTYWDKNGQKGSEWTYKDGRRDGLHTMWYENGQKNYEQTFKDGNSISIKRWNEDGSMRE